jgi:hypothetical protein
VRDEARGVHLNFQEEKFADAWPEFKSLAEAHWHETEAYRHGQPFNVDVKRYEYFNSIGFYRLYTARVDGKLVGDAGMYVTPSMHTQVVIATEDTWFLLPEYRKGRNALRFHRFVEEELKKLGVVEINQTAKLSNGAGRILEYLGYEFVAKQYSKHLGEKQYVRPLSPAGT